MVDIRPPAGVETFEHNAALTLAKRNMIVAVFGWSKTGKTHFAIRCQRPLYLAYLDPRPDIEQMLLAAEAEFPGKVHILRLAPVSYENLTREEAASRVKKVEDFAAWARAQAGEDVSNGLPGGTFVLDGGTMFKGYTEKDLLGESATLGYRAKKGERGGPSTFDYAVSNGALRDFVSAFSGSALDVVITWEGRMTYKDVWDGDVKRSQATGRYKTTMPDRVPFAMNAEVETLFAIEDVVADNKKVGEKVVPKIRIGWNGYGPHLQGRLMNAKDFAGLKRLFLADLPDEQEAELAPLGTEVREANTAGLEAE